ncbi:hypothetical protein GCM10020000_82320 [Streptomyces olivoverticillatus]
MTPPGRDACAAVLDEGDVVEEPLRPGEGTDRPPDVEVTDVCCAATDDDRDSGGWALVLVLGSELELDELVVSGSVRYFSGHGRWPGH